jgi:hypothetical protein
MVSILSLSMSEFSHSFHWIRMMRISIRISMLSMDIGFPYPCGLEYPQ